MTCYKYHTIYYIIYTLYKYYVIYKYIKIIYKMYYKHIIWTDYIIYYIIIYIIYNIKIKIDNKYKCI